MVLSGLISILISVCFRVLSGGLGLVLNVLSALVLGILLSGVLWPGLVS